MTINNHFSRRRNVLVMSVVFALFSCGASVQAAARTVESVVAEKAQWPSFAMAGTTMVIEGRYSSIAGKQMRFRNCDLVLQSQDGKSLVRPSRDAENVEVYGRFALVNAKPVFLIERINEKASDMSMFRGRQRELRDAKAEDWYELGRWAATRGAFYEDRELESQSREAYTEAIQRERKALPANAVEPLVELSKKVTMLGLPDALKMEFAHDAWQRRWQATAKTDIAALRGLAAKLGDALPGARVPLNPPQSQLAAMYRKDPQTVYRDADEATRFRLHRLLYIDVLRTAIMKQVVPDGANGDKIADELDKDIPEDHTVAELLRDKELALRVKRVETATRQDARELAEELTQRNQPEQARSVLVRWVKVREERLRKEGPTGLLQAAEEYEVLLKDRETAQKLLVEAYEIDPQSEVISRRLKQLGYQLKEGRWLSEAETSAIQETPLQKALREGRVIAGMTAAQVRKALGAPESIARSASAGETNEIWTYANSKQAQLVVHLQRRGRAGEFRTVSVTQVEVKGN